MNMDAKQTNRLLDLLASQAPENIGYSTQNIRSASAWADVLAMTREERSVFIHFTIERLEEISQALQQSVRDVENVYGSFRRPWFVTTAALVEALPSKVPVATAGVDRLAKVVLTTPYGTDGFGHLRDVVIRQAELSPDPISVNSATRHVLLRRANDLRESQRNFAELARIAKILGEQLPFIEQGEAWANRAREDVSRVSAEHQKAWYELFVICRASGTSPTSKFFKSVDPHITMIDRPAFISAMQSWLPLVDRPREQLSATNAESQSVAVLELAPVHIEALKAFAWICGHLREPSLARSLGALALTAYKKIPGKGPRAIKLGSASIAALGQIPGKDSLAQLAMLKVKVKFIPAQKAIDKALTAAAEREGLPREEIEELAVPSYGLTDVGLLEEPMGDFTAKLTVRGVGDIELVFARKDGKVVKSIPAAVKASHAEELKELKLAMKDIAAMLPAQKDRIDAMFLDDKSWAFDVWRERYLDHPLIGVLARKLIWDVRDTADGAWRSATWLDGRLCDARGEPITLNEAAGIVRLWHPIGAAQEEALAWRRFFEDRQIKQPFKQAHREVYLLTDAERRTATYSNRFAAHVIKQHQFHALAALRGWRNKLRLMVDAEYEPPFRRLERWGLRAEYWVEGAGDGFGTDTNESGAFLHLVTDQVRFYRATATQATAHAGGGGYSVNRYSAEPVPADNEPLLLETVPALVFSEIMRDVDLFVGVCSVANNPDWQDGGPQNRYREYWWHYGFGDLSGGAQSRRDLLTRLVPRLKIASVCALSEKFLVVRGKLRTYKIHLGSGNILMEPNDQYLCIVPTSRDEQSAGGISLPFEGDRVLSIILSKAFMLAEDDKIKDPSIVSQIQRT